MELHRNSLICLFKKFEIQNNHYFAKCCALTYSHTVTMLTGGTELLCDLRHIFEDFSLPRYLLTKFKRVVVVHFSNLLPTESKRLPHLAVYVKTATLEETTVFMKDLLFARHLTGGPLHDFLTSRAKNILEMMTCQTQDRIAKRVKIIDHHLHAAAAELDKRIALVKFHAANLVDLVGQMTDPEIMIGGVHDEAVTNMMSAFGVHWVQPRAVQQAGKLTRSGVVGTAIGNLDLGKYLADFADKSVLALVQPTVTPSTPTCRGVQLPNIRQEGRLWQACRSRLVTFVDCMLSAALAVPTPRGIQLQHLVYEKANGSSALMELVRQLGLGGDSVFKVAAARVTAAKAANLWIPEEMDLAQWVAIVLYPDNVKRLGTKQAYCSVETTNRTVDRISTSAIPVEDGSAQYLPLVDPDALLPAPIKDDEFSMHDSHLAVEEADIVESFITALLNVLRWGYHDPANQLLQPGANIVQRVCPDIACPDQDYPHFPKNTKTREGRDKCPTCSKLLVPFVSEAEVEHQADQAARPRIKAESVLVASDTSIVAEAPAEPAYIPIVRGTMVIGMMHQAQSIASQKLWLETAHKSFLEDQIGVVRDSCEGKDDGPSSSASSVSSPASSSASSSSPSSSASSSSTSSPSASSLSSPSSSSTTPLSSSSSASTASSSSSSSASRKWITVVGDGNTLMLTMPTVYGANYNTYATTIDLQMGPLHEDKHNLEVAHEISVGVFGLSYLVAQRMHSLSAQHMIIACTDLHKSRDVLTFHHRACWQEIVYQFVYHGTQCVECQATIDEIKETASDSLPGMPSKELQRQHRRMFLFKKAFPEPHATPAAKAYIEQLSENQYPNVQPNLIMKLLRRSCCMNIAAVRAQILDSNDLAMKEAFAVVVGEMQAAVSFKPSIRNDRHDRMVAARRRMLPAKAALGKHNYTRMTCHAEYWAARVHPSARAMGKQIFSIQGKAPDEIGEQNIKALKAQCPRSDNSTAWNQAAIDANAHHRGNTEFLEQHGITVPNARPRVPLSQSASINAGMTYLRKNRVFVLTPGRPIDATRTGTVAGMREMGAKRVQLQTRAYEKHGVKSVLKAHYDTKEVLGHGGVWLGMGWVSEGGGNM